jgi:hypothetical protein
MIVQHCVKKARDIAYVASSLEAPADNRRQQTAGELVCALSKTAREEKLLALVTSPSWI